MAASIDVHIQNGARLTREIRHISAELMVSIVFGSARKSMPIWYDLP